MLYMRNRKYIFLYKYIIYKYKNILEYRIKQINI